MEINVPGPGEWLKAQGVTPEFHPDPSKEEDPLEKLIQEVGPEGAFDELTGRLDKDPNDAEARRQANLLVNRLEDLASRLRGKVGH